MGKVEREDLWDYIDASDVLCIVDALAASIPLESTTKQDEGYSEALDDIVHAALLDAHGVRLTCTKEHIESWYGHVATTASDHGYCNAIEDMLNSITNLIAQRY